MFGSHGHFELTTLDNGRIVKVVLLGEWNEVIVDEYLEAMKNLQLSDKWVAIADISRWGGATPEFQERYLPVIDWCIANGEVANAHVTPSQVKMAFASRPSEYRMARIPQRRFDTAEEALEWAREFLENLQALVRHERCRTAGSGLAGLK